MPSGTRDGYEYAVGSAFAGCSSSTTRCRMRAARGAPGLPRESVTGGTCFGPRLGACRCRSIGISLRVNPHSAKISVGERGWGG